MRQVLCILVFAGILYGCSNPWAEYQLSEAERVHAYWYEPSTLPLEPRYCYRTLARVDCYRHPLPGEANRRVGYFHALAY